MSNFVTIVVAIVSLALLIFFDVPVSSYLANKSNGVHLDNVFSAIFDWSSIQTGFLFGVYGYVASKGDGFIAAIRKTPAMLNFKRLLAITIYAGFALTIVSMFFLIYPLQPIVGWQYNVLSAWFSLFCWCFALFCIVAYRFGRIVNTPDQEPRGVG